MEALLVQLANLQHWEIALLATYLLYQGMVIAVFPEEVIIATLGLLWSQGRIGFFEALVAVWMGLLPANATTVFLGSRFGPRLLVIRPFCWIFKKEVIEESLFNMRKHRNWIVFVTRFTPMIRGPIYVAAGLSQIGILRFMKIDAIASCIQIPLLLMLGSWIGKGANSLMQGYQWIGIFMAAMLVSVFVVKWIVSRRKRVLTSFSLFL